MLGVPVSRPILTGPNILTSAESAYKLELNPDPKQIQADIEKN